MPVRLIVIGPDGAGKSALLVRYLTKRFIESYQTGCDVVYRHQVAVQDSLIEVEILDASAYERRGFSGLSASVDWADSFLVVYDVTMLDSGPRTRLFLELVRSVRGASDRLPIVLVGNKTDMAYRAHVGRVDMEILSSQYRCKHFLVSAAEDTKIIDLVFTGAAAEGQVAGQCLRKSSLSSKHATGAAAAPAATAGKAQQAAGSLPQKQRGASPAVLGFSVLKEEDAVATLDNSRSRTSLRGGASSPVAGFLTSANSSEH